MARIFITGSADGLGLLAARELISQGHEVVLHARNEQRRQETSDKVPAAAGVLTADLGRIEQTIELASKVNALGPFDCVIHNAGLYRAPAKDIFAVNTLAPYILTSLIQKPKRLIFLSSDLHMQGHAKLGSFKANTSDITYSDSKLHVLMLCKAIAHAWPDIYANAVNPGWVPTKMGGAGASDDLKKGYETQIWLAVSDDVSAKVSGRYFYHKKEVRHNSQADDLALQNKFLKICEELSGVIFPSQGV
jgi:NAD(P)-dependent dehydrogenase (short-subunit alcohol dehydrogenase family)